MNHLLWVIPALPLFGVVTMVVAGRRLGEPGAGWVATLMVGGSFATVVAIFVKLLTLSGEGRQMNSTLFTWIPSGNFKVSMGILADPLSITMCLFVTGVSALIHLYSIGYMTGDKNFSKFFLYLNLFVFSMLVLVLGDNLLLTFLGWEGVGACSYWLISFWHDDPANATAGKKAFITGRIGDWWYMVGTFLMWTTVGSLNYVDIAHAATAGKVVGATAIALALMFLVASTAKSAQIPLFVWLPDAMAGPTPVSALIHAATMVTSGVYLLVRLNPILAHAEWANDVIAWIGVATALVAATIAITQNDIKKVLAYSTVSQLGFLFLAVGTGNYVAAIFHMITHAFFKALMFLGSGSVILGMEHEQDMRRFGNLRKYMPITAGTFIVGWLAIAGVPPFSGFWSKDEILSGAWSFGPAGKAMWFLALIAALLTAFYLSRLVIMTFFGEEKWREADAVDHDADPDHAPAGHGHLTPEHTPFESPWTMTVPLVLLAGLALVGGVINTPFTESSEFLANWLEPVTGHHELPGGVTLGLLMAAAIISALLGIAFAFVVYVRRRIRAEDVELDLFAKGWYINSSYAAFIGGPGRALFDRIEWFDRTIINGAVNGAATVVAFGGSRLRKLQTGRVTNYVVGVAAGAIVMLVYVVMRVSY